MVHCAPPQSTARIVTAAMVVVRRFLGTTSQVSKNTLPVIIIARNDPSTNNKMSSAFCAMPRQGLSTPFPAPNPAYTPVSEKACFIQSSCHWRQNL